MMDTAKGLLVKELSIANNVQEVHMAKNIEQIFEQA